MILDERSVGAAWGPGRASSPCSNMKQTKRLSSWLAALALAVTFTSAASGGQLARPTVDAKTTDANITRLTAGMLEQSQLAHHPFDGQLAGTVLDRYLDALDGSRSLFLQSDVDEFARYRATLAQATRAAGDTSAAQRHLRSLPATVERGDGLRHVRPADREVRVHRARQLLVRSRKRQAAGHDRGGPSALVAAAAGAVSAGEAERQAAGPDRQHADPPARAGAAAP